MLLTLKALRSLTSKEFRFGEIKLEFSILRLCKSILSSNFSLAISKTNLKKKFRKLRFSKILKKTLT